MKHWIKGWLAFVLVVASLTPVVAEASAVGMVVNGVVKGEITDEQDGYVYELEVVEAGRLTLDITSSVENQARYQLSDQYNQMLLNENISGQLNTPGRAKYVFDVEPGTYRMSVYDTYGDGDRGKFEIVSSFKKAATHDVEPNDGTAQAQSLPFGRTTRGFLSLQDSLDVYKVVLSSAGRFSLNVKSYVDSTVRVTLSDSYNRDVFSENVSGAYNNPGVYTNGVDLEAGTYFLMIEDRYGDGDTGIYEVRTTFAKAGNVEREPNNGTTEAMPLPFYNKMNGFLSWNDSEDFYKIVVPKSSIITLDLTSYVSSQAKIVLQDANNNYLINESVIGRDNSPGRFVQRIALNRGTYYVSVVDSYGDGDTGKYQLLVKASHLLPSLVVNKVTTRSTKVSGKTEKNASVVLTIGNKSYTRKADAKGNYSFNMSKKKAGTSITVTAKNKYGSTVKRVNVLK